ncbi:chromate transporter [Massilia sp. CF038]|uniref:chromate transporter n=1 Tax=Massilia sp. CF038 TaxID=1881045 RepID=UPI0009222ECD|nr:chromate transporter [Massilia sp. CF038]SHG67136.1 chromate transporter [Massilia sp. CF038]
MSAPQLVMDWGDWGALFGHYLLLSLLSIGGAISTSPEMQRYLVEDKHWLSQVQFNESIALAQAAPGPNVLFVALLGWHIGMNAGGIGMAMLGMTITMSGILIPSTVLTYSAAQWGHRNRELRAVRAFKLGMAPAVVALMLSTSYILGSASGQAASDWPLWLLTVASALLMWRTRVHILWLLGSGAVLGWLGLV